MKKLTLTIAIVLGLTMTSFAEDDGGLFNRADNARNGVSGYTYFNGSRLGEDPAAPALPAHHQYTNQSAPLGSGIVLLAALGGAYLVGKKRREE